MRLFVALALPEEIRGRISDEASRRQEEMPPARWVRSDALHLTLAFFGEVAAERAPELTAALAPVAGGWARFEARLRGAGGFPPRGPVRVVWLSVEPAAELEALASALRRAAASAGLAGDDKPFAPHVTLARCRQPWPVPWRARLDGLAPAALSAWRVDRVTLFASELAPEGARYRALAELPFGGEAAA